MQNIKQLLLYSARLFIYFILHLVSIGLFILPAIGWHDAQRSLYAQLMNLHDTPLGDGKLFGGLFTFAGMGEMYLSDILALSFSFFILCAISALACSLETAVQTWLYRRSKDPVRDVERLSQTRERMISNMIYSVLVASSLAFALYWDARIVTIKTNHQDLMLVEIVRFTWILLASLVIQRSARRVNENLQLISGLVRQQIEMWRNPVHADSSLG